MSWMEGTDIHNTRVEMENLDIHVEFQPQDDVLCTVDHSMRQCNGVKLTADSASTGGRLVQTQAVKFDYLGDFDYLVYASRNKYNLTTSNTINTRSLVANIKIFSPRHTEAIYEVDMPFYNGQLKEKFWVAFCLKASVGINNQGVRITDPQALSIDRPQVSLDCSDGKHRVVESIPQPTSVQVEQKNQDNIEISWQQPNEDGGASIANYRIFIEDKMNQHSFVTIETSDSRPFYKLSAPQSIWGK